MTYLLSIDPGDTTGIALGFYSDKAAYEPMKVWAVHGGARGFYDWWWDVGQDEPGIGYRYKRETVCEDYINDSGPSDDVALEVIGVIKALERNGLSYPLFQLRSVKSQVHDDVLKDNDIWYTGKKVRHADGRDVNDAIIHGIAYCKLQWHLPTLEKYFPDGD